MYTLTYYNQLKPCIDSGKQVQEFDGGYSIRSSQLKTKMNRMTLGTNNVLVDIT